jgi:hypothetical protein
MTILAAIQKFLILSVLKQMGDEMSKRQKFLFLTWVGPSVGVIKRAKMSTDKAMVKDIIVVSVSNSRSRWH